MGIISLLTIVIPTFNKEDLVNEILKEIHDNPYVEIIITDDSSNDEILKLVKKNSYKNTYYKKNYNKSGNPVKNWNNGIALVKTKYFILLHHDEIIKKEDLRKVTNYLSSNDLDILIMESTQNRMGYNYNIFFPKLVNYLLNRYPKSILIKNYIGSPSNIVYKKSIFKGFNEALRWYVDVDCLYRSIINSFVIKTLKVPIYSVFNNSSITSNFKNKNILYSIEYNERLYLHQYYRINKFDIIIFSFIHNFIKYLCIILTIKKC